MKRIARLFDDQRIRFLFIGGINTVIGYGVFVLGELTVGWIIGYVGSLYLSYLIAVPIAFLLHRRVTFRAHESGSRLVDFLRFSSVYVVSLVINTVGLPLLVEFGHLPPIAAQAIMVVVTTVLSYAGHKYFSFRRRGVEAHTPVDATKTVPSPETSSDDSSAT